MAQATRFVGEWWCLPPPWCTIGGSCGGHCHRGNANRTCCMFSWRACAPAEQAGGVTNIGGRNTRSSA
eukprot:11195747-Lingulodinium_polyedra.AAC.1